MKTLKRFWCWLTRHDWSWRDEAEVRRQLFMDRAGVDDDGFFCYRCKMRWQDRWGNDDT